MKTATINSKSPIDKNEYLLLADKGLQDKDIAEILGVKPSSLSRAKKTWKTRGVNLADKKALQIVEVLKQDVKDATPKSIDDIKELMVNLRNLMMAEKLSKNDFRIVLFKKATSIINQEIIKDSDRYLLEALALLIKSTG